MISKTRRSGTNINARAVEVGGGIMVEPKTKPKETRPAEVTFASLEAIARNLPELRGSGTLDINRLIENHPELNAYVKRFKQAFQLAYAQALVGDRELSPTQARGVIRKEFAGKGEVNALMQEFDQNSETFAKSMLAMALQPYTSAEASFGKLPGYETVLYLGSEDHLQRVAELLNRSIGASREKVGAGTEFGGRRNVFLASAAKKLNENSPGSFLIEFHAVSPRDYPTSYSGIAIQWPSFVYRT